MFAPSESAWRGCMAMASPGADARSRGTDVGMTEAGVLMGSPVEQDDGGSIRNEAEQAASNAVSMRHGISRSEGRAAGVS